MTAAKQARIEVAAAVIRGGDGRILLSLRRPHLDQGGLWEFPGGKRKPGEARLAALARELHEELGIEITRATPLIRLAHAYPDKDVHLDVWDVSDWNGEPVGREGQAIAWVDPDALDEYAFPAANTTIVTAVRAPRLLVTLSEPPATLPATLAGWLAAGIRAVVVALPRDCDSGLLDEVAALARSRDAMLHFAGLTPDRQLPAGAGRHVPAAALRRASAPDSHGLSVEVASIGDVECAERAGADWIVVASPASGRTRGSPCANAELHERVNQSRLPAFRVCSLDESEIIDVVRGGYQGAALEHSALDRSPPEVVRLVRDYLAAAPIGG